MMLTALAACAALLVAVPAASARPADTSVATKGCWLAVINDWLDNSRVDKTYATACYTQAIQRLNQYPDVQNYSSAADDIQRALLASIHDRGPGGTSGTGGGTSGGDSGSSGGSGDSSSSDPISSAFEAVAPSNAQSIPLPLLVLGGLAALLLLSAVGTWIARRIQARRGPVPAPAVEKRS
jgi:Predicted membrane protein